MHELLRRLDNGQWGNRGETGVMEFRTDALEATAARHLVSEEAIINAPGRVLKVGLRVNIHDRGTDRCRDVDRPGVVRDEERRCLNRRHQVANGVGPRASSTGPHLKPEFHR